MKMLKDTGSIPGSGSSPGGGNGNLRQYCCLENPTDRGAWWAIVHGIAKNQTQLSTHTPKKQLDDPLLGANCPQGPNCIQRCTDQEEVKEIESETFLKLIFRRLVKTPLDACG